MNSRVTHRRLYRRIHVLPSLLTIGNFTCGFISIVLCLNALFFAARAQTLDERTDEHALSIPSEVIIDFDEQKATRDAHALYSPKGGRMRAGALFHWACVVIFFGMIFDMLDGKVARHMGASSAFGVELDSLADVTTFGIAPAIIVNTMALAFMPATYTWWNQVIIFGAIFAICGVLRLARYNIQAGSSDKNFFSGLPVPAAAGCVVSAVLLTQGHYGFVETICGWLTGLSFLGKEVIQVKTSLLAVFLLLPGLLMVTTVPFVHVANRFLSGKKSFTVLVLAVLIFALVWQEPRLMLFILFNGYMLAGLAFAARKKYLAGKTTGVAAAAAKDDGGGDAID